MDGLVHVGGLFLLICAVVLTVVALLGAVVGRQLIAIRRRTKSRADPESLEDE